MIVTNEEDTNKALIKKLTNVESTVGSPKTVPKSDNQEIPYESSVRPRSMEELVGRKKEKKILNLLIKSTKTKWDEGEVAAADHVLVYGPPGLGKTTIAHIMGNELGVSVKVTSGPAIERQADLISLLTNLEAGDVLFIDEIHRLKKPVEEILYPAMEDFQVDIIVGQGTASQSVRFTLPKFTLIGATTRAGMISPPLRDRFGVLLHLDYYEDRDIVEILRRLSSNDGFDISEDALLEIARRSRGTARIAVRLFRRVKEYMTVHHEKGDKATPDIVSKALTLLGVDPKGLDSLDRKILEVMIHKYAGGPVGLKTLSAAVSEEEETIQMVYEPFLIRTGLIKRTPKGRVVTQLAYDHLEITI